MQKLMPSKTNNSRTGACDKTDCAHCLDHPDTGKAPEAENKDMVAASIFRKYYEALLQGYSIDFFQAKHNHGNFHCT